MTEPNTVDARDLSCQALAYYVDPSYYQPTFHGLPVVGHREEVERRTRAHITRCDLMGHRG
jgi:hypothetical protein